MLTGRSGTDPVRTVDLGVTGMTCGHCERRVVKALKAVEGVADASADARSGKAQVTLNSTGRDGKAFRAALDSAIEAAGYGTGSPAPQAESRDKLASYAAGLGLAGAFALAEALGLFHSVPATDGSAAPAALLVIGLLTGLHCVSMCGGIALSQGMKGLPSSGPSSASALAPSVAYNAGRVVSYTLIGALAGALGGVLDLGSRGRAFIMAAAGLFMILMGLRLVGILPQARIRLPFLHRLGARAGAFASNSGPFAVGIANGFMPCGPLQAMQVYALSAGGAAAGALSMFLFSLGTVPVLLAFGAGGAFLPHRLREGAVRAGAVLVAFLGITTLGRAWALSGLESPTVLLRAQSITAVEAPTGLARAPASTGMAARAGAPVVARRIGDYQVVEFDLAPR
ncbi:MAG TPA: sulfite exporter TauE/SafE family protein, partial [Magnetospirillaceae bacterium]|nr:sulfite exporter TauE/SafE family protein [Magnetospirillaceae bacterium]